MLKALSVLGVEYSALMWPVGRRRGAANYTEYGIVLFYIYHYFLFEIGTLKLTHVS